MKSFLSILFFLITSFSFIYSYIHYLNYYIDLFTSSFLLPIFNFHFSFIHSLRLFFPSCISLFPSFAYLSCYSYLLVRHPRVLHCIAIFFPAFHFICSLYFPSFYFSPLIAFPQSCLHLSFFCDFFLYPPFKYFPLAQANYFFSCNINFIFDFLLIKMLAKFFLIFFQVPFVPFFIFFLEFNFPLRLFPPFSSFYFSNIYSSGLVSVCACFFFFSIL